MLFRVAPFPLTKIVSFSKRGAMSFEQLTPDRIIGAVEAASGMRLTGLVLALPSYINRVYELRATDGTKVIAKFYRPGRWTRDAIVDEHNYVVDCCDAEIPVVAPLTLNNGSTLAEHEGVLFALYPKRSGRQLEMNSDADWTRTGSLVARVHLCGEKRPAPNRITLDPGLSTLADVNHLCDSIVTERFREPFRAVCMQLVETAAPLWSGLERIRIHGDCHRGNILDRLDEGLLLIDFDDMASGPPVQDLWLLLPDRAGNSGREIELFLQGYELFRRFDRQSLRCIEPLRAMRMVYFLAWCGRQAGDAQFKKNFPDWGSDRFWQREISDLREQMGFVMETM
jgi:Ser/Thr protein kinase RdoA (MazF antagonist)